MDFGDFLTLDVIINKDKSLVASFLGPKTKRQRRKAYERWLNTPSTFNSDDVSRQRLTEAAARMVYGNPAVDHYMAHLTHCYPWKEQFVGAWNHLPLNEMGYYEGSNLRYHQPTYNAHHPTPVAPRRPTAEEAAADTARRRAAEAAQAAAQRQAAAAQRQAAETQRQQAETQRQQAAARQAHADACEREDRAVFEQRLRLSIERAQPKALPSAEQ